MRSIQWLRTPPMTDRDRLLELQHASLECRAYCAEVREGDRDPGEIHDDDDGAWDEE